MIVTAWICNKTLIEQINKNDPLLIQQVLTPFSHFLGSYDSMLTDLNKVF